MMTIKVGKDNNKEIVRKVQEKLGVGIDGIFGPQTEAAVIDFQRENDLVADGIVGTETLTEMDLYHESVIVKPKLELADKIYLAKITSKFEGAHWTCNKDWEFEGWFDRPKRDGKGNKLKPADRPEQPNWKPISWSKYGTDPGHVGLSWGFIQFTQDGGNLGTLLRHMREKDQTLFDEIFGSHAEELVTVTCRDGKKVKVKDGKSPTGFARRSPRVQPIDGHDLWESHWTKKFDKAGREEVFQQCQQEMAVKLYFDSMIRKSAVPYGIHTEAGLSILFDRSVQLGPTGCRKLLDRYLKHKKDLPEHEMFKYLYHKIKDRRWGHRMQKLIYGDDVSFFKVFKEVA